MKAKAIVFTSNTGHSAQYARLAGESLGLPVYSLVEAKANIQKGERIVYFGWLFANRVHTLSKASKHFDVIAVCGVGLCDTGTFEDEVRKASRVPAALPVFTLQGGMDRSKLRGFNKLLINMLMRGLASQKQKTEQDERMLELLTTGGSMVSMDSLTAFFEWYGKQSE